MGRPAKKRRSASATGAKAPEATAHPIPQFGDRPVTNAEFNVFMTDFLRLADVRYGLSKSYEPISEAAIAAYAKDAKDAVGRSTPGTKSQGPVSSTVVDSLRVLYDDLNRLRGKITNFNDNLFSNEGIEVAQPIDPPPPSDIRELCMTLRACLSDLEGKYDTMRDRIR